jgi:predicted alpha/beta-fold hydrolase
METIVPALLRRVPKLPYKRERIETPDGDFLDLDWMTAGHSQLAILSHGLEGNSSRRYIRGMAAAFSGQGWDVLAWNCRSCSGEMNRALRMYHHGASDDLDAVITRVLEKGQYKTIVLIGFSMGGSITIKYLGERGVDVPKEIRGGVAFSVPCDLPASASVLNRFPSQIYRRRFLRKLKAKIASKASQYPDDVDITDLQAIRDFDAFDTRYSAPISGFASLKQFYDYCSARNYVEGVRLPFLLVNALNDPMLPPSCFPVAAAKASDCFYLEMPRHGGHVGFSSSSRSAINWAEQRALDFASALADGNIRV